MSYAIDIVLPWVDDSDPEWQKQRSKYDILHGSDNSSARYRDWGLLPYWFRSVEKYAPWVRTIHFVTFGHIPPWLNIAHPKLHIVEHKDYIPERYLPTFSSHTIELNLHRIPGLSERFLYFNDDVYFSAKSSPEDFFYKGLPVDSAILGVVKNTNMENFMPYIMLNMMAMVNMKFSQRNVVLKNFGKWFSPKYGKYLLNNLYLIPWSSFTGFRNFHGCSSFCKSTLEEVWNVYGEILDQTCCRRFRSREDVNQYIFRYWQLLKGDFVPGKPRSAYLTIGEQNIERIKDCFKNKRYRVVCVNDDPMGFDFESEQQKLSMFFEQLLPDPSSYELEL